MTSSDAHAELFRSSWSVYDAIVQQNYMCHREIHACVADVLGRRSRPGGFALLDLGCGNARWLADTLRRFPPVRYVGVDLSRAALKEAAVHLRPVPAVELREQDLLACALSAVPASFDVVYSSFAMHHLSVSDKGRLFQACASLLAPAGEFLLVDVIREDDQTREQYLENYLHMMRTEWRMIEPRQMEDVIQHITAHDFPETVPALVKMAQAAGFLNIRELGRFRQNSVIQLRR